MQIHALTPEAERYGIPIRVSLLKRKPSYVFPSVEAERFSVLYSSYNVWKEKPSRSSAHERRIQNYMIRHPDASLREARGHKSKGR
jgi:hypothetical protein